MSTGVPPHTAGVAAAGAAVDVAVVGAGGPTGRLCVAEAVARGLSVRAVVRDPAKYAGVWPAGVAVVAGDVTRDDIGGALVNARSVVYAAAAQSFFAGAWSELGRVDVSCGP
jgi:putative NADH-flavin reductase